jgi:hypothetical protein
LSSKLELQDPTRLIDQHETLRNAPMHDVDDSQIPGNLMKEANALFEELDALSITV